MLHSRGPDGSELALVLTQVLQGIAIGGGIAALSIQVSFQVSVIHGDVAMVTAVFLLITEFGGAGGGAISWIPVFLPCVSILILFQLEPFGVARCRRSSRSIYRSCLKPSGISCLAPSQRPIQR
jgi:hypothetical protein